MGSYGSMAQTKSKTPSAFALQTTQSSNNNGNNLSVLGYATALLTITGTISGGTTVNFEGSADGGTSWVPIMGLNVGTLSMAVSSQLTGHWTFDVAGYSHIRARISNYSSGSVTVTGYLSVLAGTAAGAGNNSTKYTYMAVNAKYTVPATPTDMIVFTGSSQGKIAKIQCIRLTASQTTLALDQFLFVIRGTTPTSGGTAVTATAVPLDSANPSATCTLKHYTANPTQGTAVGTIVEELTQA